jgi:hypothetical protein
MSAGVSCLPESTGGMRSESSAEFMRAITALVSGCPGTIAA